jgi:outer membrane lipoprotein-sorting protein
MLLGLAIAATAALSAVPETEEFFARFKAAREGVTALRTEYTEKNITPDETLLAEGTLTYTKPRRILRHTHYPYDASILIDQTTSYQYEPEVFQLVIQELADAPESDILFFGFDSDTERLRESYDVKIFALPEHPLGKLGIELRPKAGSDAADLFREAVLYLRDDNMLPYRVHLIFDEESQLIVEMGDYEVNPVLEAVDTQIAVSPGTKVIVGETVSRVVGQDGEMVPMVPAAAAPAETEDAPETDAKPLVEVKELDAPAPVERAE